MREQDLILQPVLNSWTKITFYGWLLAFLAVVALAFLGEGIGLGGSQLFVGLGTGLGIGYTQARWLRKHRGTGWWWMWGSAVGMGFSFTFFDLGHRYFDQLPDYNLYYSIIAGGVLCGLLQFRTLRSVTDKFITWIPVCIAGWLSVTGLIYLNDNLKNLVPMNPVTSIVGIVLLIFGPGLIFGLVTGVGMRWILKPNVRAN